MSSLQTFAKKGIVVSIIVIIVFFGAALWKERHRKGEIDGEIEALKREAEKIERENMKIEEKIAYLASKEYRELQAKEKLNMQNPGEKLIIISKNFTKEKEVATEDNFNVISNETIPNYEKWWKYFFQR